MRGNKMNFESFYKRVGVNRLGVKIRLDWVNTHIETPEMSESYMFTGNSLEK